MPDFPPPPPPAPPKKSRTNLIIIGSAVAVIAAVIGTGAVVVNSRDDKGSTTKAAETKPADDTVTAAEEPEPTPSDTGPQVFGLTDTVSYETGVEVSLSKFTRGMSSEYATPENTPYVRFTVKVKNGSTDTVDVTGLTVNCSYGQDGSSSDSIFDTDKGLEGGPETRLLAGRSISVPWGCEFPKGESSLQVEVSPDYESETAIFTGRVK
ncbi:hypothetical protein [Streptomyces sp. NBC_00996]|uniref:hypothetical protein n=1 Tax=Streptomyces sp. NBC_00996 TaxID=2903710 RepID=UPI00386F2AF5|nr:hypothetical protein OG390_41835 [Streptomyces sp. NBC_00996]